MPPMVKFPAPQMARGKSLLRLSNARNAEKEEAPLPSPKSHESKLAVGSDEPPLKEAAARPRAPKTRGISSLRLLKSKPPRPKFEPAPGMACEALYTNGEWYRAKLTATSRATDGSERFVARFEDDGVTLHLPRESLRRAVDRAA